MDIHEIATRLSHVKWRDDTFMARCPAHEDQTPSLSGKSGDDESVLLHCHAGCTTDDVLSKIGLSFRDLYPTLATVTTPTLRSSPSTPTTYGYRDESGTLLYQKVRLEPKDFRLRRPDGQDRWIYNLDDTRRVLYRLNELQDREAVVLCEGEKDADRLWALGIPATTTPDGAKTKRGKNWRSEYSEQLVAAGLKRLVATPDNDKAGGVYATDAVSACHSAGITARVLTLPLPPKGDVSDWLDAGHTKNELHQLLRSVLASEPQRGPTPPDGFQLTSLRDLLAEPEDVVSWLVEDRIPAGGLALLAGKPKTGKSTMTRDLAFAVSRGVPWLGWKTSPGAVWYLALEDKRSEVRRHFRQMGATGDESIAVFTGRTTQALLPDLHKAAAQHRPALIIVDTMQRLIQARDLNDYAEVTRRLEPLLHLARETGAAVLLLHHAGKSQRADLDAVLGSTALTGSVDTVLVLKRSDRYRTVTTIQRVGVDVPQTVVSLDPESGRVSSGPTQEAADEGVVQEAMLEVLRAAEEPMLEKDIGDAVEGKTAIKRRALRQLVDDGAVIREGAGKRNDPYRYSTPVSCFLVPALCGEQENKKPDAGANDGEDDTYSRPGLFEGGGSRSHQVSPDPEGTQAKPSPIMSADGVAPFVAENVALDADEEML